MVLSAMLRWHPSQHPDWQLTTIPPLTNWFKNTWYLLQVHWSDELPQCIELSFVYFVASWFYSNSHFEPSLFCLLLCFPSAWYSLLLSFLLPGLKLKADKLLGLISPVWTTSPQHKAVVTLQHPYILTLGFSSIWCNFSKRFSLFLCKGTFGIPVNCPGPGLPVPPLLHLQMEIWKVF